MKLRVVRGDGMILARGLGSLMEASSIAADLSRENPKHEYFVRSDDGKVIQIRGK